jgi:L-fuculose-phosphate aldolase
MRSDRQTRELVLDACRGLAANGLGPGIGGHVSSRVPGEARYFTNVFEKSFEEMQLEDIVEVDFDGRVLDAGRSVSLGLTFHAGIYQQRADVGAVVHSHGFWMTAQSALGRPPRALHNLTTYFYERTCISPSDDFASIGPALRPTDVAIIIPWHGAITVGPDVETAVALHVTLDYAARLDVTLPAAAPAMPREHALEMRALIERADHLKRTWELTRRKGRDAYDGRRVRPIVAD